MKTGLNQEKINEEMSIMLRKLPKQRINVTAANRIQQALVQKEQEYAHRKRLTTRLKRVGILGFCAILIFLGVTFLTSPSSMKALLTTWGEGLSSIVESLDQKLNDEQFLGFRDGFEKEQKRSAFINPQEWEVSEPFQFYHQNLVGKKGQYGVTNQVLFKDKPMQLDWYIFSDQSDEQRNLLTITAIHSKTRKEITLVEQAEFRAVSEWSEQQERMESSLLVECNFPEEGLWMVELQTEQEVIGNIVVEVFDKEPSRKGYADAFEYETYDLIGKEGDYGLYMGGILFIFDSYQQHIQSNVSLIAVHSEQSLSIPVLQNEELFLYEDAYSISLGHFDLPKYGEWDLLIYLDQKFFGNISVTVPPGPLVEEFVRDFQLDIEQFNKLHHSLYCRYSDPFSKEDIYLWRDRCKYFIPFESVSGVREGVLLIRNDEQEIYHFMKLYDGTNVFNHLIRDEQEERRVFLMANVMESNGKNIKE